MVIHRDIRSSTASPLDLEYDAAGARVWASVPSGGGPYANSVVAIDFASGALGPSVFVGSEPGELALSADGSKLYVALGGADSIVRVDVATLAVDLEIALGADPSGAPYFASDVEVAPGGNATIAVARAGGVRQLRLARLPQRHHLAGQIERYLRYQRRRLDRGMGKDEGRRVGLSHAVIAAARIPANSSQPTKRLLRKRSRQFAGSSISRLITCQARCTATPARPSSTGQPVPAAQQAAAKQAGATA